MSVQVMMLFLRWKTKVIQDTHPQNTNAYGELLLEKG